MSTTKRISLFVPTLSGGGAERAMLNLSEGLAERQYDVFLTVSRGEGELVSDVPDEVTLVDFDRRYLSTSVPDLARHLRKTDSDAVISSTDAGNLVAIWAVAFSNKSPTTLVRVENMLSLRSTDYEKWRYHLIPPLLKIFYRFADEIIAVSKGVAQDVGEVTGIDPEEIRVLYNPVVTDDLLQKRNHSVDHPWLVDDSEPVILSVGRLVPQKDYSTLIRAFGRIVRKRDVRLIIAGKGDCRDELLELATDLGISHRVSMPGYVDNQYAYMAHADVFVLSSAWEGFGNVLVEAMACGTPVVSTDCESGPAEILESGTYGPLVPVGEFDRMAAAIQQMLDDPTDVRALEDRAMDFSQSTIVDEYVALLER